MQPRPVVLPGHFLRPDRGGGKIRYEIVFNEARIRAWSLMGEEKEFAIEHIVKWNSTDDTLVI